MYAYVLHALVLEKYEREAYEYQKDVNKMVLLLKE